jgi:GntR family transcriptional regulator, rspAB operon transcriptional repressor
LALRKAIRDGSLEPETLYSELQLAAAMSISRTPVREALIELSREGIIDVVPQRGFRIRAITPDEEREVLDLRGAIESYVVRKLSVDVTEADIAQLRVILDEQARVTDDPALFVELDETFHLTMPALMGLRRTQDLLGTLRGIIFLTGSTAMLVPDRAQQVIAEHRSIVDAVAAGDRERAVRAVLDHLDQSRRDGRLRSPAGAGRAAAATRP